MKRAALTTLAMATALVGLWASTAGANTGHITTWQNCDRWTAKVELAHNVTADRSVDVISTIAGHPGFTGHHYNTQAGQIWYGSGFAPKTGDVTLNIYRPNGTLEHTSHASLPVVDDCQPPPTTTTTVAPTTTTTVPETTTTLPSETTTTVPPETPTTGVVGKPTTTTSIVLIPPTSATQPPVPTGVGELAKTGNDALAPVAMFGAALLLAGLLFASRRKAER